MLLWRQYIFVRCRLHVQGCLFSRLLLGLGLCLLCMAVAADSRACLFAARGLCLFVVNTAHVQGHHVSIPRLCYFVILTWRFSVFSVLPLRGSISNNRSLRLSPTVVIPR